MGWQKCSGIRRSYLGGGIWLASLGGSLYYIITGVLMLAVSWLLFLRSAAALWLYALVLIGSMIWAVWEVGFDFWALTPRCDVLVFFGIWLLLQFVYRGVLRRLPLARAALAASLVIAGAVLLVAIVQDPQDISGTLNTAADVPAASSVPPGIGRPMGVPRPASAIRRCARLTIKMSIS